MKYNTVEIKDTIIKYIDTVNQIIMAEKLVEELIADKSNYDRAGRIKDYKEVVERQKEKEIELREQIVRAIQA